MFRVTGRTVLHLGAELISSDAVAFYELIKNSFDAGSEKVAIRILVRVPHDALQTAAQAVPSTPPKKMNDEEQEAFEEAFADQEPGGRLNPSG